MRVYTIKKGKIILLICTLLLLSFGCKASEIEEKKISTEVETEEKRIQFFSMDTFMDIRTYGIDENTLESLKKQVMGIENIFSVTLPTSEIYKINDNSKGTVSDTVVSIFSYAQMISEKTKGAFDISIYPAVKAWGFTGDEYHVLSKSERENLLSFIDYKKIKLENHEMRLPKGMKIDFGGIIKGFASDEIVKILEDSGCSSALINLGGNVHGFGKKPNGNPWRVGIRNPLGEGLLGIVDVEDKAVITSGGYERHFEKDGEIYFHILDPKTAAPAKNGLVSVTIVGEKGILCDALSTALFVMGKEKAISYWETYKDFDFVLVTEDKQVFISQGLKQSFELVDAWQDALYTVVENEKQ